MVYISLLIGTFAALAAAIPQQAEHISNAQLSRLNQVFARDDSLSQISARGISMDGSCGSASGLTCGGGNCCSSLGWCGATPLHCGTGCQAGFGNCGTGDATSEPVTTTTTTTAAAVETTTPVVADKPATQNSPAAAIPQQSNNGQQQEQQGQQQQSGSTSTGLGNIYKQYSGDGSTGAGWPSQDQWADFETSFAANQNNLQNSCAKFGQKDNTPSEIQEIHNAILTAASSSGVDSRYILAIVLQESGGCVRAPTTSWSIRNPGLMQSFNGQGTCNDNGNVQYPCPSSEITQMINDGTSGTGAGSNSLVSALGAIGGSDVSKYYKAARVYNSGSIDGSGQLQSGIATHCYSSDIANRLTGWTSAAHSCTFDG